jgi:hypothetical protein
VTSPIGRRRWPWRGNARSQRARSLLPDDAGRAAGLEDDPACFLIPRSTSCSWTLVVAVYWRLGFRPAEHGAVARELRLLRVVGLAVSRLMIASTTVGLPHRAEALARDRPPVPATPAVHLGGGNFAVLGFFKYFDFFIDSAATALQAFGVRTRP